MAAMFTHTTPLIDEHVVMIRGEIVGLVARPPAILPLPTTPMT